MRASLILLGILLLVGCLPDNKSTLTIVPSRPIDTWLLGIWEYRDAKGNRYRAGVFPLSDTHYSIEVRSLSRANQQPRYFDAFISRVDKMSFLNLFPKGPVSGGENTVFYVHYQLQSPIEVIVTPIRLSIAGKPTPWKLRQEIRVLRNTGTLLPPRKSIFWEKTSEVYWQENASLESQPKQRLRIPIPDLDLPSQDAALWIGPAKGYRSNR